MESTIEKISKFISDASIDASKVIISKFPNYHYNHTIDINTINISNHMSNTSKLHAIRTALYEKLRKLAPDEIDDYEYINRLTNSNSFCILNKEKEDDIELLYKKYCNGE